MISRSVKSSFAIIMALGFCFVAFGADNYAAWQHNGRINFNTTSSGANVAGNVINFPVLVRLNGDQIDFSQVKSQGADIRFAKADGTHLKYQIERWVDGAGTNDSAEIWVKMDTVFGNSNAQYINIYWGKSDAADSSSASMVFETSNSFTGVYHISEGGTGTRYNAAQASYNMTTTSYDNNESKSCMIGKGDSLEPGDYLSTSGNINVSNITLSAWVNPSQNTTYGKIILKPWSSSAEPWQIWSLQQETSGSWLYSFNVATGKPYPADPFRQE
jgi:hypothetical protein